MAEKFYGPYSSKSLPTNNFWGFNENDDTLLRFKMNDSVAAAIQSAFTSIQNLATGIEGAIPFPEDFTNTLDMYRDMFANAELIPYTYVLKNDIHLGVPYACVQNDSNEFYTYRGVDEKLVRGNTTIMSTVGFYDNEYPMLPSSYVDFTSGTGTFSTDGNITVHPTFHKISGFSDDYDLVPTTSFNAPITAMASTTRQTDSLLGNTNEYAWPYQDYTPTSIISSRIRADQIGSNVANRSPYLMKKSDASKLTFSISGKVFDSYSNLNDQVAHNNTPNYHGPDYNRNLNTLLKIDDLADIYDIHFYGDVEEFISEYGGYTVPCSLKAYNNSNDGTYSSTNKRPTATMGSTPTYLDTTGGLPNIAQLSSELVFFVKTKMKYYNDDGTEDTTRDPVQYWAFNIQGLWKQSNLYGQSRAIGTVPGVSDIDNYHSYVTYNYMSLGIGRIIDFYIPFPLFMKTETEYFNNTEIFASINGANDSHGGGLYRWAPVRNGFTTAFANPDDFEVFLRDGLGLDARFSYELARQENTTDWPNPEPSPDVPNEPGSTDDDGGKPNPSEDPTPPSKRKENIPEGEDHTGTAFLSNAWAITVGNVKNLQAALTDNSIWTSISNFFKDNPSEGVLNVVRFPFNLANIGVTINDTNVTVLGEEVGNNMVGTPLPTNVKTKIDMGTIKIEKPSNSYLDYSPFTKVTLYLPFFGYKDLDTNMVMGKTLHIYYDVDYGDGSGLAIIRLQDNGNSVPLYTFSGNIGTVIPITKSDGRERIQSNIKSVLTTVAAGAATIATGGVAAPVMAGITGSAAVNSASSLLTKPNYSSQGVPDAQHTYAVNNLKPFVIVEYPSTNIEKNYGARKGYQTNLYRRLNSLSGFTVCDNVRLDGLGCTDTELTEIKNILSTGVIL